MNLIRITCVSAPNSYKRGSNNRLDFCTSKLDTLHDLIVIHHRIIDDVIQGYDTITRVHYYVAVIKTYPIVEWGIEVIPFLLTFIFLKFGILDLSQDPFDISKANALRFCNGGC